MPFAVVSCLRLGSQRAIEVARCERRHVLEAIDSQWTRWKQIDLNIYKFWSSNIVFLIVSCLSWLFRLFLVRWQFAWFAEGFRIWCVCKKHTSWIHVVSQAKPTAVRLYLGPDWNSWSPASATEVLAPQQPIVTASAPWFNPLISKLHQKRTSGPGWGQGQTRWKRVLLGGPASPSPCPGLEAISSHSWGQHKHRKHRVSYQILSFFIAQHTEDMPQLKLKAQ